MIVHTCEQGSDEWFSLRAGKPTASCFDKLITSTAKPSKSLVGYAITLAGELYAGKPLDAWEGNSYTERGKLLEDDARKMYAFMNDVEPEIIGFVTDDALKYGCSPDSLVKSDGMLEIKCLKAENHIKAILCYRKHNNCPPDYVQQTQGQLMVCERDWCDLFFFHPDLPQLIIRQERNEAIISALSNHIETVINERDKILIELRAS
jgi:hypothetical protein